MGGESRSPEKVRMSSATLLLEAVLYAFLPRFGISLELVSVKRTAPVFYVNSYSLVLYVDPVRRGCAAAISVAGRVVSLLAI